MTTLATWAAGRAIVRGSKGPAVSAVQTALRAAGAELVIDGNFGRITEAAVKRFQAAHRLTIDGIVGVKTGAALDAVAGFAAPGAAPVPPARSALAVAPWLATMRAITGTREVPGPKDNPLILGWRDEIARRYPDLADYCRVYDHDSVAWCGLATAYCMAASGIRPVKSFLWAQSWAKFGQRLSSPVLGAVMVFARAGGGHVALYEGQDAESYHVRGGNQSDNVTLTRVAKSRLVGITWPADVPLPSDSLVGTRASGALSVNEA